MLAIALVVAGALLMMVLLIASETARYVFALVAVGLAVFFTAVPGARDRAEKRAASYLHDVLVRDDIGASIYGGGHAGSDVELDEDLPGDYDDVDEAAEDQVAEAAQEGSAGSEAVAELGQTDRSPAQRLLGAVGNLLRTAAADASGALSPAEEDIE